jgi:hypothetical protein
VTTTVFWNMRRAVCSNLPPPLNLEAAVSSETLAIASRLYDVSCRKTAVPGELDVFPFSSVGSVVVTVVTDLLAVKQMCVPFC